MVQIRTAKMASKTVAIATSYPDAKVPVYKNKTMKIDSVIHTEYLSNAYKTTRDVAKELQRELEAHLEKARQRVMSLVKEVNELKKLVRELKQQIVILKRELKEAQDTLNMANAKTLHPTLLLLDDDPDNWCKAELDTAAY